MLKDVIRFEWRYHTRQVSFIAAALFFAGFGFALTATGFGPANVHVNSPYDIAQTMGLISLAAVFAIAIFCANSVVRDREHQFEEIVFSTSVEKFPYLFGRFAGSFLAAFTVFSATAVGMMIASLLPLHDASRVGPFSIIPYFWTLLVLVLPGMLVAGVTLFGIATLTRSVLASVVGAVAIYVFYFGAAAFTNSPLMAASAPGATSSAGASLLDPFGLSAFFEQTRYWTPDARNTLLISMTGDFLLNRIIWLAFAANVWLFVYKRFSFRVLAKSKPVAEAVHPDGEQSEHVRISPPLRSGGSGLTAAWRPLIAATRIELRSVLRSIPFILLTLLWTGLTAMEILSDVAGGEYGAAFYPTTGLIFSTLRQPLGLVATVIIIYYSAELIWRERAVGMAEILNATPSSNAIFVLSKWLALSAQIVVLIATGLGVGVIVQLARGFHTDPVLLLAFAAILGIPLMIFAMLAVLIQTLSPSKYFGLFAVLVAGIFIQAGSVLGIEHPLLKFASAPPLQYTEMNGFGASAAPFLWFMALWTAMGLLFLLVASALWRRVSGSTIFRTIANNISRSIATVLALIVVALAAFIFYNTNVLNRWSSRAAALDWNADYEKTHRVTATMPRPHVAAINANVELYPNECRYHVTGNYDLVNDGATPIAKVLVSVSRDAHVNSLALPAATVTRNERFATYDVQFAHPLQPREHRTLHFDLTYDHRGFSATAPDNSIATNGSFIGPTRCFPVLGYRRGFEISDPIERKKHGLPPSAAKDDEADLVDDLGVEWTNVDITLSTAADQIALAPGRLINTWTANGRRYFHYRSDGPIHNNLVFASARYAVARATAGKTAIEVYYHPAHRANVARILTAAADSIRVFENSFGPYPQSQLRIAEAPSYLQFGGLALPGLIFLSESRAFLIDARDPSQIDLVSRRTAHEVAHQWWGHSVTPAVVPGASAIIESLPRYSELLILDKRYGRGQVRRSLGFELDRYLAGRISDKDPEVPLSRVDDQAYLYYGKGAIVMNALKELLGEETLNRALRGFVAAQSGPAHQPRIDDLLNAIEAVTPEEDRALVNEWTREVILYDLALTSASSRRLSDGRFEVTMQVTVQKSRADEHKLPVNESIEIGIFASDPDIATANDILHLAAHPLHSGANTITVIVDKQPSYATIDPYLTRIDRNRFDNVKHLSPSATSAD